MHARELRGWCLLIGFAAGGLLASGCSRNNQTQASEQTQTKSSVSVSPEALAQAEEIFATRCTPCHGTMGKGDGPASKGLTPPPRDLTDPEWQKSVTDEHLEKIIQYGGAAVGKSAAMPPNPDLNSKAEVVIALRNKIRDLSGK
ncbi:MAG: c-type cytochrome [Myxococcales bacterium]|nr:MAG: c-type cytochrome [Myxococcales bacterium]